MVGQSNQDEKTESREHTSRRGTSSGNASELAQINYPQVDVRTLEKNIVSTVLSDVDNVMISVETRVQDAVSTAMEKLAIPRVELAMKSANAHSERSVYGIALQLDQREFLKKYRRPTDDRF